MIARNNCSRSNEMSAHHRVKSPLTISEMRSIDRKTVRGYIAKGLEPPTYKKRSPSPGIVAPFAPYLRERLAAYPGLTGRRLCRELKERGYQGGYTAVTDMLRELRPPRTGNFEAR